MFPLLVSTTFVYLFPIHVRDAAQMDFPYVVCAASREEEKNEKQKAITSKCFLSVGVADGAAAAVVCNLTVTKNILTGFGKLYTKL